MAAPLHSLVSQQEALVQEAALALPSDFSTCTYDLGYIKQAVYLCLTCAEPRGICAACSIACHSDHEQIELFPKRHFCCDCPTSSLGHPCTLKKPQQPPNVENAYGQNFERGGRFCRCSQTYDASIERETMVQCLACQDWFHESCLSLRERVPPRQIDTASTESGPQPAPQLQPEIIDPEPQIHSEQTHPDDDATSIASDPSLPPALIPGDTYDTLICGPCVLSNPTIRRYAGTPGARMLALGGQGGKGGVYKIIGEEVEEKVDVGEEAGAKTGNQVETEKETGAAEDAPSGSKRRLSPDAHPPSKRQRASAEPDTQKAECIAPVNSVAQAILDELEARLARVQLVDAKVQSDAATTRVPAATLQLGQTLSTDAKANTQDDRMAEAEAAAHSDEVAARARAQTDITPSSPEVYGDVFLSVGWRERWCRCSRCDPPLLANPYLLEEEETYEPPKDPDAGLSLEELGMRALSTLPHERALDSIRAYNSMRDDLMLYLRPFAESGREVSEADITAFFEQRRQR